MIIIHYENDKSVKTTQRKNHQIILLNKPVLIKNVYLQIIGHKSLKI